MNQSPLHAPLNQIALSVVDLRLTERWFREGLGFLPAGGSRFMSSTPLASLIQGVPGAASTMWWMVGREGGFQIELFQFRKPMAKLMPADFRPCDTGYTRMGVLVDDFDATLARLAGLGSEPHGPMVGSPGQRRACVRSPDGVYVEIMEDDPLDLPRDRQVRDCATVARSVTVSTPNLEASVAYFSSVIGKGPEQIGLHEAEHEALWGLEGARCRRAVFRAGTLLLEVVQYLNPVGKPWPADYRICDQGILNIAFGADNRRDFQQVYERAKAFGARQNFRPVHLPFKPKAGVVYVNDALGFSVELVWMAQRDKIEWGWEPLPMEQRPAPDNQTVHQQVRIRAPLERVWSVLNDQPRMARWIGFDPVVVRRQGFTEANGVGSERLMHGTGGQVVEQVISVLPQQSIRYRLIEGSPFVDHQGAITLHPIGSEVEVRWTIRFRSRIPLLGGLLRPVLNRMLQGILRKGLKPFAEGGAP